MKISIIVPIYNVEKQLRRCIDGLLKQDSKELQTEIILVNDGSTDNSGNIAKEYASKYKDKIIYFEKENEGVSEARNFAIPYVTGEYMTFVDSDDYIEENLYAQLLKYMNEEYDLVKFKAIKVNEQGEKIEEPIITEFDNKTGEEAFDILYKIDTMIDIAWIYIYKSEFYKNNNFRFDKGLYHEDFGLMQLVMIKAKKVASTNIGTYNYVQTQNSITRGQDSKKSKMAKDLLVHYDNMINEIVNYNISKRSKENLKIYYTNCIILNINNLQGEDRKNYIKEIRKRKMTRNIKARNIKQLLKKAILAINIEWYLKLR